MVYNVRNNEYFTEKLSLADSLFWLSRGLSILHGRVYLVNKASESIPFHEFLDKLTLVKEHIRLPNQILIDQSQLCLEFDDSREFCEEDILRITYGVNDEKVAWYNTELDYIVIVGVPAEELDNLVRLICDFIAKA